MTVSADSDIPLLRIRGPADLMSAVPYLLGFHPEQSLVLIGLTGNRVVVTARMDLADLIQPELLEHTIYAMANGGATKFVCAIFDDTAPARMRDGEALPWDDAADDIAECVADADAELDEVLLVGNNRLWSLTCTNEDCCPRAGRVLEPSAEVAATATYAGLVALPDRATVAGLLEPRPLAERARLMPAIDKAERAGVSAVLAGEGQLSQRAMQRAIFAAASAASEPGGSVALSDEQVVDFGVALRSIPNRDAMWLAIDSGRLDGRPLWRELAARLPAPYDAPALFLFGWATWRDGGGVLAGIAVERALESDPGYTAADLLGAALSQAVDPRTVPKLGDAQVAS